LKRDNNELYACVLYKYLAIVLGQCALLLDMDTGEFVEEFVLLVSFHELEEDI
jgi:hypothetical protein